MIAAEGPQKGLGGLEGLGSPLGKVWDAWDGFPRVGPPGRKTKPPPLYLSLSLSLSPYICLLLLLLLSLLILENESGGWA